MKFDTLPSIYLALAVFVPGFIYNGVLMNFVPLRQNKEKELIILRFLTTTAFNYAICSPVIYLLLTGNINDKSEIPSAVWWFLILFIVPIALALIHARAVQKDGFRWLYKLLGLRAINPIPTGWDWIFSRTEPCFVLITLKGGTEVAGWFGPSSMASSDPERKDIYLEKVYTVPEDGSPWQIVSGSLGIHIDGSEISLIEFRE